MKTAMGALLIVLSLSIPASYAIECYVCGDLEAIKAGGGMPQMQCADHYDKKPGDLKNCTEPPPPDPNAPKPDPKTPVKTDPKDKGKTDSKGTTAKPVVKRVVNETHVCGKYYSPRVGYGRACILKTEVTNIGGFETGYHVGYDAKLWTCTKDRCNIASQPRNRFQILIFSLVVLVVVPNIL